MAIVDAEGRLWGRLNLLDAVLAVLLLGLVPLGYGAYALFRTPPPRLMSLEPTTVTIGPNLRVAIRGENLRPFLRVSFGTHQGLSFLFRDSTRAEVELNEMPPGVYDVVLYDFGQERSRLPQALTILPAPPLVPNAHVVLVGMITGLKPDQVPKIVAGMSISDVGEVLEVGRPLSGAARVYVGGDTIEVPLDNTMRVPATLRVGCFVRSPQGRPDCLGAGVVLQPSAMVPLSTPLGPLAFQIDQVRGTQPLEQIDAVVHFVSTPEVIAQISNGDIDAGPAANELAAGARVIDAGTPRQLSAGVAERDVRLTLRAQRNPNGLAYAAQPLRIGGTMALRTAEYELGGTVMQLTPRPAAPDAKR